MNTKSIVSLLLALVTFALVGCNAPQQLQVQSAGDYYPAGMMGPQQAMLTPMGVPPKSVAFLNFIPRGCAEPLQLMIDNDLDSYATLQVDGFDVTIMGAQGPLPSYIPPKGQVFLCLDQMGFHSISGTQYTLSGNRPIKMFDYKWSGEFTATKRHSARLNATGISI